jgi:hypothetical protein
MAIVVEAMRSFQAGSYEVRPGSRLLAWKAADGWRVIFNGSDVPVPDGTVGEIDSVEVKKAAEERKSAREEEYQLAPTKTKA